MVEPGSAPRTRSTKPSWKKTVKENRGSDLTFLMKKNRVANPDCWFRIINLDPDKKAKMAHHV
jgi:hypothetical protein